MSHIITNNDSAITVNSKFLDINYTPQTPSFSQTLVRIDEYNYTLSNKNWFPFKIIYDDGQTEHTYYWYDGSFVSDDDHDRIDVSGDGIGTRIILTFSQSTSSGYIPQGRNWVQIISQSNATPLLITTGNGASTPGYCLFNGFYNNHDVYKSDEKGGVIYFDAQASGHFTYRYTRFDNGTGRIDSSASITDLSNVYSYDSDEGWEPTKIINVSAYSTWWGVNKVSNILKTNNNDIQILTTNSKPLVTSISTTPAKFYDVPKPLMPYQAKLFPIYIEMSNGSKMTYFDYAGFHFNNTVAVDPSANRVTIQGATVNIQKMICIYVQNYSDWGWAD